MKVQKRPQGEIAIIDPALKTPELECFNHLSTQTELSTTYHLPALQGFSSFSALPDTLAGIVVLGSGASVHDGQPWQDELHSWLQSRMIARTPTLGLCYGHQAIAHIFGGSVELLWEGRKAKGVRDVSFRCDRLGLDLPSRPVVVSHREGVTTCPEYFEMVGFSNASPTEAFRHAHLPIWGVQAHVEAVAGFLTHNEIPAQPTENTFTQGHQVVNAFLKFVERRWRQEIDAAQ